LSALGGNDKRKGVGWQKENNNFLNNNKIKYSQFVSGLFANESERTVCGSAPNPQTVRPEASGQTVRAAISRK